MHHSTFNFLICCAFALLLLPAAVSEATEKPAKIIITDFAANSTDDVRHLQSSISALLPARIAVANAIVVYDPSEQIARQYSNVKLEPLTRRCAWIKQIGADYLLTGTVTKLGKNISIDAQLLDARSCSEPDHVSVQCAGADALIPEIGNLGQNIRSIIEKNRSLIVPPATVGASAGHPETGRQGSEPAAVPQRSRPGALFAAQPAYSEYIRSVPLLCLAAGDVNGDGLQELITAGGNELHVLSAGGGNLVQIDEIKAPTGGSIVHIDSADLNGHAPDEIYVSSFNLRSADSSVLEYRDKTYAAIQTAQPWFFRVLERQGGSPCLIGQDAALNNPFAGAIRAVSWSGESLNAGAPYNLPRGINIYGFAQADIAQGAYLAFTSSLFAPEYGLKLLSSGGKQVWRDSQSMGGTANFFRKEMFANQTEVREPLPLRILFEKAAPGGKPYVIVGRNVKKGQKIIRELINYNQGEVLCLVWNGADFQINWRSSFFSGYVADYIMADIDGDGRPELCVLSSTGDTGGEKAINKITVYRSLVFQE